MGCCLSCLKSGSSQSETEMTETTKNGVETGSSSSLAISMKMSAPTIEVAGLKVSGLGLALASVSIEQDAAYWEWHIESADGSEANNDPEEDEEEDESLALKFGVATKKDSNFYRALDDPSDGDAAQDDGTALMRPIVGLRHGDTVGVAVQQSDLPMVQFLLNGEPLHDIAINRFRGSVFPAVYVQGELSVTAVFDENAFKEMSPHVRFGPLIAARGII